MAVKDGILPSPRKSFIDVLDITSIADRKGLDNSVGFESLASKFFILECKAKHCCLAAASSCRERAARIWLHASRTPINACAREMKTAVSFFKSAAPPDFWHSAAISVQSHKNSKTLKVVLSTSEATTPVRRDG
jgi:hypothetical protein